MQTLEVTAKSSRIWVQSFASIAVVATVLGSTPALAADEPHSALLASPGEDSLSEAVLPRVLGSADTQRYRQIFALQEHGQWRAADRLITRLKDKLLLGEVLAERYRDERYQPSYAQLVRWLKHYADEPDARAIYALALEHRPAEAAEPPKPKPIIIPRDVAKRRPTGRADAAKREAKEPASPASLTAAENQWQAGLADWRTGRLAAAGHDFEALARNPTVSIWTRSAAAFWAARVALRSHQPEHVAYWLGIAAERPRTFYGLLARRVLGVDTYFNFASDPFTELDGEVVASFPGGQRALALLAVGQRNRAAAELRLLAERSGSALGESIEALADRANLPGLSLQLAAVLADSDGRKHDYALYPVPRWQPRGGFSVDRALLFALMRQESLFAPGVKSSAGALGLMQLMPATARSMAVRAGVSLDDRRRHMDESKALANPELNLTLAQEYVQMLLNNPHIRGNLLVLACAYNSGPAATLHWRESHPGLRHDPLLFLESIPWPEARVFTERVLTNYWIYRIRLGQPTPDLDALAAGEWPTYIAFDPYPEDDSRHAAN